MDGIDGIAGMEAVSVCLGAVLVYQSCQLMDLMLLPLILLAAVLGFLFWNIPRASIFMGDVGSGFLGLILGCFAIQAAIAKPVLWWSWMILLGVFIIDATITLGRRCLRGEAIHLAHRNHAYQHAARLFGHHMPVTLGVALINVCWLWPWAWMVGCGYLDGFLGVFCAYLPLIGLAMQFNAGFNEKNVNNL